MRGRPLLVFLGVLCVLGLGGLGVRVWQSADLVTAPPWGAGSACLGCVHSELGVVSGVGGGMPILSTEISRCLFF